MILQNISNDIEILVEEGKTVSSLWLMENTFRGQSFILRAHPARSTELISQRFKPAQGHFHLKTLQGACPQSEPWAQGGKARRWQ